MPLAVFVFVESLIGLCVGGFCQLAVAVVSLAEPLRLGADESPQWRFALEISPPADRSISTVAGKYRASAPK